jgi:hypothetical protein
MIVMEVLGDIAVLRDQHECENRRANGQLACPPRLFVPYYDACRNEMRLDEVGFDAAEALAPDKFRRAMELLEGAREREGVAIAARFRAERAAFLAIPLVDVART